LSIDLRTRIEQRLRAELAPSHLEVIDEGHLHAGHAGAQSGKGHLRAVIVSSRFEGLSPVAAQRLVYEVLAQEMRESVHALALRTYAPAQWEALKKG